MAASPAVRRWAVGVLLGIVAALALLSGVFYVSLERYNLKFVGMTEAQVVDRIGKPYFDDRKTPRGRPDEFLLVWSDPVGHRLILKFKNGVVVSQSRSSR